jgi:acetolactate synthase-1/2/3 large subunit
VVVPLLLQSLPPHAPAPRPALAADAPGAPPAHATGLNLHALGRAFNAATQGLDICLTRLPLGWPGGLRHFRHPLDYLGLEGGGGVGAGPGLAVGAALALRGSGRVPVAILGDGDFLMGNTAVWTAAHYGIGCLLVVANNRSFFNDEVHQEKVARHRGRPVANKWIGQRIAEPDIDLAGMARSMGALGIGPASTPQQLDEALAQGLRAVRQDRVGVIDVRLTS